MLHKIHRKLAPEEEKIIKPKELPTLPLTDEDSFSDFQKFLTHDTNFYPVNSRVAAILQILVDRQEELNGKVEHVILILHKIHRKLAPEEETIIKPKELPTLPLTDEDSFSDFQKFLTHDTNFYPVDYFAKLMKVDEHTDEYTAVGRILPKVITNSLARAVLKAFPDSNLVQAEKMSRWFYTSPFFTLGFVCSITKQSSSK
ncbi:hypothetical protein X777_10275 [Ooceraea biroi]|uniref:Uncharacterized protein n=1 Tax=Ooceraea biroi TaxID=2015173 RepID=A0A026W503_OOCBI|nr:hypothetical protein X777_10275 [Ooceraea biroi]